MGKSRAPLLGLGNSPISLPGSLDGYAKEAATPWYKQAFRPRRRIVTLKVFMICSQGGQILQEKKDPSFQILFDKNPQFSNVLKINPQFSLTKPQFSSIYSIMTENFRGRLDNPSPLYGLRFPAPLPRRGACDITVCKTVCQRVGKARLHCRHN